MADEKNEQQVENAEVEKTEAAPAKAAAKAEKAEAAPKAENSKKPAKADGYMPRLKADYDERIVAAMIEKFGYKNKLEVPKLDKIVINMGVGEATQDKKRVETAAAEMELIAGQKPVITKAKKSIASFKLREGMPIGVKVTLRRERMYEFLDRLVSIAMPRVRDFRGVSPKAFDGRGNYTIGVREQLIFPEIDFNKVDKLRGMNITIITTARNDEQARALLKGLGMPFRT